MIRYQIDDKDLIVEKFGERPRFGTRVPDSLLDIFGSGDDRKKFIKGRRSEDQGFGVGSFAYYRRVVENQKNNLIDRIIKVAKIKGASEEDLEKLESAKKEKKFSSSVDIISELIPESLYLKTHNPLTLLHDELSKGIHNKSDKECLELAKHIRVILSKLVEKMDTILSEEKELTESLNEIFNKKKGDKL